jgi:arylsulfatase A-like enzyme
MRFRNPLALASRGGGRRRLFVALLSAGLLAPALGCRKAGDENVLLIIGDDVGADMIGLYTTPSAGTAPPTPRIDALSAAGVRFKQAWSNPVCSPTRAGLYTGQPPHEHGVGWALSAGDEGLAVGTTTLPNEIGQRYSALFGKWHVGDAEADGTPNAGKALEHGFYAHIGNPLGVLSDAGVDAPCSAPTGQGGYFCWDKYVNGVELCAVGDEDPDCDPAGGAYTRYATIDTTDEAIAWIDEKHTHGDPWLAVVAYNAAHTPLEAPDPACLPAGTPAPTTDRDTYEQMVQCMDQEIGRLLDALADSGALEDTTVIFVGDNGTEEDVGNGYYPAGHWKTTVYQGGVRVPLIVADGFLLQNGIPDLRTGGFRQSNLGATVSTPVHTQDLFNTIVEIAGQTPLSGPEIDSVSLVPYLLSATAAPQRTTVYTEVIRPDGYPCDQAIRDDRFKLIRKYTAPAVFSEELYNLDVDPTESNDLMSGALNPVQQAAHDSLESLLPYDCS